MQDPALEPGQISTETWTKTTDHTRWPCPGKGVHDCNEALREWNSTRGRLLKGRQVRDNNPAGPPR